MSINKSLFKIILLLSTVILIGCKDAEEVADRLTHFNFDTDYNITVPANPIVNIPVSVLTPDITTTSEEEFAQNQTRADLAESVKLTQLTLQVQSPADGTLTFLKSIDIKAVADGLPEIRVAFKDQVAADVGAFLSLDVTNAELVEYFKKPKYNLRITVVTDEQVTKEYVIKANARFFVDAKVAGL
jgi:hypothetical protein